MHGRVVLPLLLAAVVAGCQAEAQPPVPSTAFGAYGTQFKKREAGVVTGEILWHGPLPEAPPIHFAPFWPPGDQPSSTHATPNLPDVNPGTRGIRNAVVFLRGVDPKKSRPWPDPAVVVEHAHRELGIMQGAVRKPGAVVRRGDEISVVNDDADYHVLRARGADFFALPLPAAQRSVTRRRLDRAGVVELSSAAHFYWMRAYLFVDDHPYYALTDADGRYALRDVPPGDYELVSWLPSWVVTRRERDAESGQVSRLVLAPAKEKTQKIHVAPLGVAEQDFTWSRLLVEADAAERKTVQSKTELTTDEHR